LHSIVVVYVVRWAVLSLNRKVNIYLERGNLGWYKICRLYVHGNSNVGWGQP